MALIFQFWARASPQVRALWAPSYATDDTDYEKPIKSQCFDQKSSKIASFRRPFLVIVPLKVNWPTPKIDSFYMIIGIGSADYSHRYR